MYGSSTARAGAFSASGRLTDAEPTRVQRPVGQAAPLCLHERFTAPSGELSTCRPELLGAARSQSTLMPVAQAADDRLRPGTSAPSFELNPTVRKQTRHTHRFCPHYLSPDRENVSANERRWQGGLLTRVCHTLLLAELARPPPFQGGALTRQATGRFAGALRADGGSRELPLRGGRCSLVLGQTA
jgi:hypothetical protein